METTVKSSKKDYPLRALKKEMEADFKKRCDECTAKRKEADEFRESKHAEEYAKLNAENKRLQDYFDEKSEEYRKNTSSNFRQTKYFMRYWIIIICLTLAIGGIITQSVFHYQHYRKMNVFNNSLKFMHEMNPDARVNRVVKIFERPKIEPERYKFMSGKIENYGDFWWEKE